MNKSTRRTFIGGTAVILAGSAVSAMPSFNPKANKLPLVHHVFFWLKNPGSPEDRDKLIEGLRTLSKIETVHDLRVSVPASTEKRAVVDTSWQVSELIFFSDLAAQSTYQSHPVHLEFVKNYSHLWEKVVVYDAIDVICD